MTSHTNGLWVIHTHRDGRIVIAEHHKNSPDIALAYIPTDIGATPLERGANALLMAQARVMLSTLIELREHVVATRARKNGCKYLPAPDSLCVQILQTVEVVTGNE